MATFHRFEKDTPASEETETENSATESSCPPLQYGDAVILKSIRKYKKKKMIHALLELAPDGSYNTNEGMVQHEDIVNKTAGCIVRTSINNAMFTVKPTMMEVVDANAEAGWLAMKVKNRNTGLQ